MIQQRKKDYLQRLIEEFFAKLHDRIDQKSVEEKKRLASEIFVAFAESFGIKQSDDAQALLQKVNDMALLEQYARLLLYKYEIVDIKDKSQLETALQIVRYLDAFDTTYSWDRIVLREDLLKRLEGEETL